MTEEISEQDAESSILAIRKADLILRFCKPKTEDEEAYLVTITALSLAYAKAIQFCGLSLDDAKEGLEKAWKPAAKL